MTGEVPVDNTPTMVMLKDKLLNNVPTTVKTKKLLDNPLMAGAPWLQWSHCLVALLQKQWEKMQQQATANTLVHIQLEQAKKVSKKNSGGAQASPMVAFQGVTHRAPPSINQWGQKHGWRQGGRGGPHLVDRCNRCGGLGHWARECRVRRGPVRGGPRDTQGAQLGLEGT